MMGIVSSSGPHESPHGDLQEPKGQRPDFQGTKCNYQKLSPGRVSARGWWMQTMYICLRGRCPGHPEGLASVPVN